MSKPILKGIDFGKEDLSVFVPEIPHNFCIWLTLSIGPDDAEGSHFFQVGICTTMWLAHQLSIKKILTLRHMMIVENFNIALITKTIGEIVDSSVRSSWDESVQVLCRYFSWEYEDYQV
jgi:hypothetical protein